MLSRRILAAVAILCALAAPAHAQKTRAQLSTEIGTNFPDNTAGQITPQNLRTVTGDIVTSIMPNSPVTANNAACWNGTTGLLKDCGAAPVPGGTDGQIQYNNAGAFGGLTQSALMTTINAACGAVPSLCATLVGYYSPLWYGAVCDNATDDAVALQAAVTAAGGKTLYVPSGYTCVTSAVLTIGSDNTTIRGANRENSGFKSLISNRGAIFYMANRQGITISDLALTGTRTVTTWALPSFGAIDVEQDVAAASVLGNFTFRNLKMSGFNSTYWMQISIGNSTFDMSNVTIDNILFVTATADIPSDATTSNNVNYGIAMYGGTNGPAIRQSSIRNLTIEGSAFCFGVGLYNTHTKFNVIDNKILNVGATNVVSHCTNGLGFTNSYGLFVYDIPGAGFPASGGIISGNFIYQPYSAGIYTVGANNAALAYNDFDTIISNNIVVGQSQTDLPIRGAIVLNNYTNSTVVGNKLYNNWAGIVASGQYTGQVEINGNQCVTNVSGGTCVSLAGAAGTTGNVPEHSIKNNTFQTNGASSATVKLTTDITHYMGGINFSNNSIVADVTGVTFSGLFTNSRLVVSNNTFSGIASVSMLDVSSVTGGPVTLADNTFDLALSTTGTGLKATSSLVYLNRATFMNRTSGAAFALSAVGATGTLTDVQFSNIATANQVVASSLGLAKPTWSGSSQDFVQNLTTAAALSPSGWVNTASGVNWTTSGGIAGQYTGTATNDSATAGNIGEYVSATVAAASPVSLTSGASVNITSISLTAGDWDVSATAGFLPAGGTTYTLLLGWTSTASATAPADSLNNGAETILRYTSAAGTAQLVPIGSQRISLSGTATVYLSVNASFAVSTMTGYGIIKARRVR